MQGQTKDADWTASSRDTDLDAPIIDWQGGK